MRARAIAAVFVPVVCVVTLSAQDPFATAFRPGNGITNPTLIRQAEPVYTADARAAKIQGAVELDAIVQVDGTVGAVRMVRSLDARYGLDEAAITAARKWLFRPAVDASGRAVPVIVRLVLEFRLDKSGGPAVDEFAGAFRPGNGVTNPTLIRLLEPTYTDAARAAKIQGIVEVDAVVRANGTVGAVRIIKSLDTQYGLDTQAVLAAQNWLFKPGLDANGTPVPVVVRIILEFRLPGSAAQAGVAGQNPSADQEFRAGAYAATTPGLAKPVVLYQAEPQYTPQALSAKIQGTAEVEIVVAQDGRVSRARLAKSVDQRFGLDETAVKAVQQWRFQPGKLDGQAVPVWITVTLEFRIH